MESKAIDFSDLEDPSYFEGDTEEPVAVQAALAAGGLQEAGRVFSEQMGKATTAQRVKVPCVPCNGSGRWRSFSGLTSGPCFKCSGNGFTLRAPGYEERRAKNLQRKLASKIAAKQEAEAWREAHQDVIQALEASIPGRSQFMDSLREYLARKGQLSVGQVEAVRRGIEKRKEWQQQRVSEAGVDASGEGLDKLTAAFASALRSGLKNPAMEVGGLCFKPAKASSANAGAIYVTAGRAFGAEYFGKLAGGRFIPSRAGEAQREAVAAVMADPLGQAVLHGKQTGRCSCCGRELENAESVELGIGPVCRRKWGL